MHAVARVGGLLLRQAEASREEYGEDPWLRTEIAADKEAKEKVAGLVAMTQGESDPNYKETDEKVCVAAAEGRDGMNIEQRMEHHAMINMGAVRLLALWAVAPDSDPMNSPDFVPKWAREMAVEGLWKEIDEVVNWVHGLKV
jgi:hypothetical protein